MDFFSEFEARGFVKQITDEAIKDLLNKESVTFYVGFDPTAKSMHVGNMLTIMAMRRLQQAGHKPVVILGGGTAMVGDPSGKITMRKMLSKEQIDENAEALKLQFSKFLEFGESGNGAIMLNNADWLRSIPLLDFLRDIGVHFSINRMLTYESVKLRLEKEQGMTFLEFAYNLLQAYDFYYLYEKIGCKMQMGGDDQWANITAGIDLIRRKTGGQAFGLTNPLLTTASGQKMGKTEKGAIWLSAEMTSPYDFYQFWINCDDRDAVKFLKLYTDLPLEEIAKYENLQGEELREAKQVLAYEATKLVHGKEEADKAKAAASVAFSGQAEITPDVDIPTVEIKREKIEEKPLLVAVLADTKILQSRGEGRRLIDAGGIYVNGNRITDRDYTLSVNDIDKYGQIIIRKGKKKYHRIKVV